jgi:aryl-alcohol dehydrogenase-like predicted oxidoreductase
MRYVPLGRSGLKVSRLALGTWRSWATSLDYGQAEACFREALAGGVNLVDVADVYAGGQAEAWLGWLLASVDRDRLVVATKAFWPTGHGPNDRGLGRKHLRASVETSLERLRTDHIDLLYCHRLDPETPAEETLRAIDDLVTSGKVLYWGICSADAAAITDLCRRADALGVPRPIANQPPYSLLERRIEAEVLPVCRALGLGQVVFSPLAQGVLTGKYLAAEPPRSRAADPGRKPGMERYLERAGPVRGLADLADELGTTCARLALAWTLRSDGIASAIFGATSPEQVRDNLEATRLELAPGTLDRLEALFPPA